MASAMLTQKVRERTGLTVPALARKLRVSPQTVRDWELGAASPSAEHAAVLQGLLERTQRTATSARGLASDLPTGVLHADGVASLKELPSNCVEMILSDIPYGIGLKQWDVLHENKNSAYMGASDAQRKAGGVFSHRRKPINGWSADDREIPRQYYDWCMSWAPEWLRVLRPGGSALVFAGRRLAPRCATALEDAGFCLRDLLSWVRPNAVFRAQRLSTIYRKRGDLAEAERHRDWRVGNLRPTFEPIIWCFKPYSVTLADNMLQHGVGAFNLDRYREVTGRDDNVLHVGFAPKERGHHEAQKPVELLRTLIELCTMPGQMVVDPFAGSGSTGVAAALCGRRCLMIETDAGLCETARQRVRDAGSGIEEKPNSAQ